MREPGPRARFGPVACLSLAALALGCAERRTVASKSADAYDQARRNDAPIGKGHGHGSSPDASAGPGKAQEGKAHSEGQGHSAAAGGQTGALGHVDHGAQPVHAMDHGAHGSKPSTAPTSGRPPKVPHAGHGSSAAPAQEVQADHSQMDHSSSSGSGHEGMAHGDGAMASRPESASTIADAGAPAASLRANDIDAPVPTATAEALRAERLAAEMAAGGHAMHHGTYSHTDAGREETSSAPDPGAAHHGHQPSPAAPAPSDDVHRGHGAPTGNPSTMPPASKPAPMPSNEHSHHGAGRPATKPSPRPSPQPTPSPSAHHQEHR